MPTPANPTLVRISHRLPYRTMPALLAALVLVACGREASEPATATSEARPARPTESDQLVVETAGGTVKGFHHGDGIVAFRGIPFAAPPVGELRWKAPQSPTPWQGVREATAFGPDCMQFSPEESAGTGVSEDCLYLNVYKPAGATAGDGLPVHVFIYGGAFRAGAASLPRYENAGDVRDGIVYVNFNYRV